MATQGTYGGSTSRATAQADKVTATPGKLNMASQQFVMNYVQGILSKRQQFTAFRDKMDAIDIAYARYKASSKNDPAGGRDTSRDGDVGCDIFASDDITPPIVVSQVDSFVAYLAETFLSGSPIFPVVSRPGNRQYAEQLETLLDDHSTLGAYPRQLLLFLRDCVKYNMGATEVKWDSIDQFSVMQDISAAGGQGIKKAAKKFNRIKRVSPRNAIWDFSVMPGDVAELGDYAGYVECVTRTKFKRLLNKWNNEGKAYNIDRALATGGATSASDTPNFWADPQISDYVPANQSSQQGVDWNAWFDPKGGKGGVRPPTGTVYELVKVYGRIMPSDFAMSAPQPNTPQIWEFVVCNGQYVVYANRVISSYDYLPMLFGQPLEDGMAYQTKSVAEGEMEFQQAASTLFNIRFAAARRAVSDRALYIPDMIKPTDINSKHPAPKIPVHISALSPKKIGDAYAQIPFDMRGTETTIQDASTIVQFSQQLHGVNSPRQGQFQKGNKSVKEWDDTMGSSDGRMRLPALVLEYQFFSPLKSILTLNIFQYGEDVELVSQKSGDLLKIDINKLRQQVLSFKIADGYTPKSKMASTDTIAAGLQMISQSPILQQAFGQSLPSMFIHFMTLSGVKGMEEYDPKYAAAAQQNATESGLPGNLPANAIAPQLPNAAAPTGIPANVAAQAAAQPGQTAAAPANVP